MQQTPPQKWSGSVSANLPAGTEADRAWSLLGDYLNLHKFFHAVLSCELVSGSNGEPGCVRLLKRFDDQIGSVVWAINKLVAIDPVGRSYSYEVMENNMGFDTYSATLRVVEGDEEGRYKVEWVYEADPVVGWTEPKFVAFIQAGVEEMAMRVAEALAVIDAE